MDVEPSIMHKLFFSSTEQSNADKSRLYSSYYSLIFSCVACDSKERWVLECCLSDFVASVGESGNREHCQVHVCRTSTCMYIIQVHVCRSSTCMYIIQVHVCRTSCSTPLKFQGFGSYIGSKTTCAHTCIYSQYITTYSCGHDRYTYTYNT